MRKLSVACIVFSLCGVSHLAHASKVTVTVAGGEQQVNGHYDSGSVLVTVNGHSETITYGQFSSNASMASAIAAKFSQDCDSPVVAFATGPSIVFETKDPAAVLSTLTANSPSWDQTDFAASSFALNIPPLGSAPDFSPTFSCSPTTVASGQNVTCTVTLVQGAKSTVSFSILGATWTTATPDNLGIATANSNLTESPGQYTIAYSYPGDSASSIPPATGSTTITVNAPASTQTSTDCSAGNPLYCFAITNYAANGNIISYSDSVNGQWTLGYDGLNRLVSSQQSGTNYNPQQYGCWSYDSFGNMQAQTYSSQQPSGSSCAAQGTAYSLSSYSYNADNQIISGQWIDADNHPHTGTPLYDASGEMTSDQVNTYLYDADGRVCAEQPVGGGTITGYIYDAEGHRVAKGTLPTMTCDSTSLTVTATYFIGPDGETMTEMDQNQQWVRTEVSAAGQYLATYTTSGVHYPLTDWLGTKRVQVNPNLTMLNGVVYNGVEEACRSQPFGDQLNCDTPALDASPRHYTGKERDSESGLDYFKYRYYASNMGRWMSPDPSGLTHADLGNPQSLNLYNYVGNNPLTRADLDGLCWKGFQWACNAAQSLDNGVHGLGFQTNASVDREQHTANQLLNHDGIQTESLSRRQVRKAYKLDMALGSVRSEGDDGFTSLSRVRPTAAQARAIWEKATGGKVPWDDSMGRFYDMSHKTPIGDGGNPTDPENLEPMLHTDHLEMHRQNGDFVRWGARGATPGQPGEPIDTVIVPTGPVEPTIPIEPIMPE